MASKVVEMAKAGMTNMMPAVLSRRVSHIPFDKIQTDNGVSPQETALADQI